MIFTFGLDSPATSGGVSYVHVMPKLLVPCGGGARATRARRGMTSRFQRLESETMLRTTRVKASEETPQERERAAQRYEGPRDWSRAGLLEGTPLSHHIKIFPSKPSSCCAPG